MTRPAKIWIGKLDPALAFDAQPCSNATDIQINPDDVAYIAEDIVVKLVEALDLCDAIMAAIIPYAEGFVPDDIFVNLKERRQLAKSVLAEYEAACKGE